MTSEEFEKRNCFRQPPPEGKEREAFVSLNPSGFHIRHPPPPHDLDTFKTPDDLLFQTIHMGTAEIDAKRWVLVVTGLVERPFSITQSELRQLPSCTVTSVHECYGSPLVPPTKALWRVGNVVWKGVLLRDLLKRARPKQAAQFIWSEGLDRGKFGGVEADRYMKDLPIDEAFSSEVLVAYEMNAEPLDKYRGAPVRLIVPGYFGTNSVKWLSKITLQDRRAPGPFTTIFYNEKDDTKPDGGIRPVWKVQPNSMITKPVPKSNVKGPDVVVEGWGWSYGGIEKIDVSVDEGETWIGATVDDRIEFSWQKFHAVLKLTPGSFVLLARATSKDGFFQPLEKARNHVHRVAVEIV